MKPLLGNENTRRITFGKRHNITVTFTRENGLWSVHPAISTAKVRNISTMRSVVARTLRLLAKENSL